MDEKNSNSYEFDLESIIGEIKGPEYDTDEVSEIIESVGGLYIGSENSDDELDSILSEFGDGRSPSDRHSVSIKAELTEAELIALREGKTPRIINRVESREEAAPEAAPGGRADVSAGAAAAKEPAAVAENPAAVDGRTRVLRERELDYENKTEDSEPDEYELLDRKIMEEKEAAFFGENSRIRQNVFNWENDRDLKKKTKEEEGLAEGQVTLLPKDETDRKLTGYFTSVYDIRDLKTNQKKLKEETKRAEEPATVNQPASFRGFLGKIFNEPEADEEPLTEAPEQEPMDFDDFESEEVKEEIRTDLVLQTRQCLFRLIFAGIISLLLLALDFIVFSGRSVLPPEIDYSVSPTSFGITVAGLMAVVAVCGLGTLASGLKGLFTLKFNNETLPSLAVLLSLGQIFAVMFSEAQTGLMTFTGVAALCFTSSILSKYLNLKTVSLEFDAVSADGVKHVLLPMAQLNRESRFGGSAGVMRSDYIKGFMDTVTAYNGTHRSNMITVPSVLLSTAVSAAVAVIRGLNIVQIMTYMAAGAALSCAFTVPLAAVLPMFLEAKRLHKLQAAVLHLKAADSLADVGEIIVRDSELFLEENMNITGVKIFNESKVYTTIVLAASIYHRLGGPLKAAFHKILDSRSDIIDDVKDLEIVDGHGVTAVVGGREVFIGVPEYIKSLGVKLWGVDLDQIYQRSGGRLVIVADSKELLGVFAISYSADKKTKNALSLLEQEGFRLRVYTSDHNITPKMISRRYKTEELEIETVSKNQAEALETSLCDKKYVSAKIISANGIYGVVSAMLSAFRMRQGTRLGDIIRVVSVAAGIVIALILAVTNSYASGGPYSAVLFQLIWTAVLTAASVFRL